MTSDADARPGKRVEKYKFTWQNMIANDPDLPLATKGVAYTLSLYARADGANIHPGNERLARQCCVTDRQLRRHIAVLEERGYLFRVCRGTNLGRTIRANQWNLTTPPDPEVSRSYLTSVTEVPEVDDRPTGSERPPNRDYEQSWSSSNLDPRGRLPHDAPKPIPEPSDEDGEDAYFDALDDLKTEFPHAGNMIDEMGDRLSPIQRIRGAIEKTWGPSFTHHKNDDRPHGYADVQVPAQRDNLSDLLGDLFGGMNGRTAADPRGLRCPVCCANAWESCEDEDGYPRSPHAAREAAA